MSVSPQKNVIFVHIPKTAGTSISASLKPYIRCRPRKLKIKRHTNALTIRERVDSELFNSAFKFTFIRNPWDLQVSLYHYILKRQRHPMHEKTKALGCFRNFVFSQSNTKFTQSSFICDENGNLLVDFVGRCENIHADFQSICSIIGISAKLKYKNRTSHLCYQHYYDDETRDLTAKIFSEDIKRFGYTFQNDSLQANNLADVT